MFSETRTDESAGNAVPIESGGYTFTTPNVEFPPSPSPTQENKITSAARTDDGKSDAVSIPQEGGYSFSTSGVEFPPSSSPTEDSRITLHARTDGGADDVVPLRVPSASPMEDERLDEAIFVTYTPTAPTVQPSESHLEMATAPPAGHFFFFPFIDDEDSESILGDDGKATSAPSDTEAPTDAFTSFPTDSQSDMDSTLEPTLASTTFLSTAAPSEHVFFFNPLKEPVTTPVVDESPVDSEQTLTTPPSEHVFFFTQFIQSDTVVEPSPTSVPVIDNTSVGSKGETAQNFAAFFAFPTISPAEQGHMGKTNAARSEAAPSNIADNANPTTYLPVDQFPSYAYQDFSGSVPSNGQSDQPNQVETATTAPSKIDSVRLTPSDIAISAVPSVVESYTVDPSEIESTNTMHSNETEYVGKQTSNLATEIPSLAPMDHIPERNKTIQTGRHSHQGADATAESHSQVPNNLPPEINFSSHYWSTTSPLKNGSPVKQPTRQETTTGDIYVAAPSRAPKGLSPEIQFSSTYWEKYPTTYINTPSFRPTQRANTLAPAYWPSSVPSSKPSESSHTLPPEVQFSDTYWMRQTKSPTPKYQPTSHPSMRSPQPSQKESIVQTLTPTFRASAQAGSTSIPTNEVTVYEGNFFTFPPIVQKPTSREDAVGEARNGDQDGTTTEESENTNTPVDQLEEWLISFSTTEPPTEKPSENSDMPAPSAAPTGFSRSLPPALLSSASDAAVVAAATEASTSTASPTQRTEETEIPAISTLSPSPSESPSIAPSIPTLMFLEQVLLPDED